MSTAKPWRSRSVHQIGTGVGTDNLFVVNYEFGYYVEPTPAAKEAMARITKVLGGIVDDIKLIREWSGNLVLYQMNTKRCNPTIDGAMQEQCFKDAKESFPNAVYVDSWLSGNQGIAGLSVRLRGSAE